MTPAMAMSVGALETMPFEGPMRNAYVEARGVELLCDPRSEIARSGVTPGKRWTSGPCRKSSARAIISIPFFAGPLAMQRLACNVGTNERKLSRAFRTVFGMTIFEYVRSRRLEEGRLLLRAGNLSVTEIAFEVGYVYFGNFSVAYNKALRHSRREKNLTRQGPLGPAFGVFPM
jgi:AraC-like DNA-binding protein